MMGRRKHSKERRQFHFDCCTSADFQFAKLQFKRHAKITRRVNIEWDGEINDAKIGEKKSKKKGSFAFQFETSFDFIGRVLTKNSILREIDARL